MPSPSRTTRTPSAPTSTAIWEPGSPTSEPRPAHTQESSKKCRRSQANGSSDVYAVAGSVLLRPNGASAASTAAGSIGAVVFPSMVRPSYT